MTKAWILGGLLAAGAWSCGSNANEREARRVKFLVTISRLPSEVDTVTFDEATFPVTGSTVTLVANFDSYDDAVAAGEIPVTFTSGGAVMSTGSVAAGACATCVYSGCPSLDGLQVEELEYSYAAAVSPTTYGCFTCSGADGEEKECP